MFYDWSEMACNDKCFAAFEQSGSSIHWHHSQDQLLHGQAGFHLSIF